MKGDLTTPLLAGALALIAAPWWAPAGLASQVAPEAAPEISAPAAAAEAVPVIRAVDLEALEARSAALILSGQEGGAVATSLLTLPVGYVDGKARVALVLDIDRASLLEGHEGGKALVEVYAYALDTAGGIQATLTQAFTLDLTRPAALEQTGVKFLAHLDLAPGDYSLRTLVLHRATGQFGLRITPARVPPPAAGGGAAALLPPLFPEPAAAWTLARAGEPVAGELPFPLDLEGRPVVPATRAVIAGRSGSALYLLGRRLAGGPGEFAARLLDPRRDREVESLRFASLRAGRGEDGEILPGLPTLSATLESSGAPAGEYLLEIVAAPRGGDDAGEEVAARLPVRLVPDTAALPGGGSRLWTDLLTAPVGDLGAPAGIEDLDVARRGRSGLEKFQAAYFVALNHLAAGEAATARRAVMEAELAQIGAGSADEQKRLAQGQLQVAVDLAGSRVESLVPLILLHEELYLEYLRRRQNQLATHSRHMMLRLVESYAQRSESGQRGQVAAQALASLGGHLLDLRNEPLAGGMFQSALAHDETSEAALLGLALLHEAYSHHEEAARLLERLVRVHPASHEGLLHLAVNLKRLDQGDRGEALFRRCLADGVPRWVRAVAYQELADLHMRAQRREEALALLREALERLPGERRLYIQLAAYLDRAGRPGDARRVLAELEALPVTGDPSPRLRYGEWDFEALLRARRSLADTARVRLPVLADTLESLKSSGGRS